MLCGIYLPWSVDASREAQDLEGLVEQRGWTVAAVYVDERRSRRSRARGRRPRLERLLAHAQSRRRPFDVVLVRRADEVFRSIRDAVLTLAALGRGGVDFVAADGSIDTTSSGRGLLVACGAIAELAERARLSSSRDGLARARIGGKQVGRPRAPLPVARALDLRAQGKSNEEIAQELGVGKATVHRHLGPKGSSATRA